MSNKATLALNTHSSFDDLYSMMIWFHQSPHTAYHMTQQCIPLLERLDWAQIHKQAKTKHQVLTEKRLIYFCLAITSQDMLTNAERDLQSFKQYFEQLLMAEENPKDFDELLTCLFRQQVASLDITLRKIILLKLLCELSHETISLYLDKDYHLVNEAVYQLKHQLKQSAQLKQECGYNLGVDEQLELSTHTKIPSEDKDFNAPIDNELRFRRMIDTEPTSAREDYINYAAERPELSTEVFNSIRLDVLIKQCLRFDDYNDKTYVYDKQTPSTGQSTNIQAGNDINSQTQDTLLTKVMQQFELIMFSQKTYLNKRQFKAKMRRFTYGGVSIAAIFLCYYFLSKFN